MIISRDKLAGRQDAAHSFYNILDSDWLLSNHFTKAWYYMCDFQKGTTESWIHILATAWSRSHTEWAHQTKQFILFSYI